MDEQGAEKMTFSIKKRGQPEENPVPKKTSVKTKEAKQTKETKETKKTNTEQANNPLHGIKLQAILEFLEDRYGWDGLGKRINIRCFNFDPSIKSSLKFLRRTPWARTEVETLYLKSIKKRSR